MEDTDNKPTTKRKIISFLVLFGFLVVLPFGSWFYLKKGADFRMAQLEELQPKGDFDFEGFQQRYGVLLPKDSIIGNAILLGFDTGTDVGTLTSQMDQLAQQYTSSEFINIAVFVSKGETVEWGTDPDKYPGMYFLPGTPDPASLFSSLNTDVPTNVTWALVDNKGQLRRFYTASQFESLIVQAAVILPTPKREKIELNR
ncbi:MAG: hypothetical protein KDC24_05950 [Saprospiraceae bacterium]|nr:hypothetical protein [Saprospiraceae bacterium]